MGAPADSASTDLTDIEPLIAGYRPLAGVYDEMLDRDGRLRPHWRPFLPMLAGLGEARQSAASQGADRTSTSPACSTASTRIRRRERAWPLEPSAAAHRRRRLGRRSRPGLSQRAALIERCCADIYGESKLVREGRLPAAGDRRQCRVFAAARGRGARAAEPSAHLCAVDIGRGPDGQWWVFATARRRLQVPATRWRTGSPLSRALPDIYRTLHVRAPGAILRRPCGAGVGAIAAGGPRVCLLTPGPLQRDLFRTCLSRALSRLSSRRGRRPDGPG